MHESVLHLCKFQNVPGYHVIQHHLLCSSSVTGARHHAHLPRTQISNDDIPIVLRNLSLPEICSLQPLTIHNGDYTRMENGYRQKGGISG